MASLAAVLFHLGILAATLTIITFAGSYFVDALSSYARKLGMSSYFIGMVVVAVATSSPDIVTSIMGLIAGRPELLSGVIFGGLALDLAFLNGLFSILARRAVLDTRVIRGIEYVILGLMLFPYLLMLDGNLTRWDGAAMVLSFAAYATIIWLREARSGKLKKQIPVRRILEDSAVFLFALAAMLISGRYAVFSAINLSNMLNIPLYILSITVLAFAAAAPDTIAGVLAIVKKKGGEIGFGESIGTTVMEVNLFIGLVGIFHPLHFRVIDIIGGVVTLMIAATYFLTALRRRVLTWKDGIVFMGIYAAFLTFEITRVLWWGT